MHSVCKKVKREKEKNMSHDNVSQGRIQSKKH